MINFAVRLQQIDSMKTIIAKGISIITNYCSGLGFLKVKAVFLHISAVLRIDGVDTPFSNDIDHAFVVETTCG